RARYGFDRQCGSQRKGERMRSYSVAKKVLLGFVAAFTVLLTMVGLAYVSKQRALDELRGAAHSYHVIGTLEQILSQTYQAESNQRAYLIVGDTRHLIQRDQSVADIDLAIQRLEQLVADNPQQLKH